MRVNVHYYESGNTQLNTSKEHAEAVSGSSLDDVSTAIATSISKAESAFHNEIDASCSNLTETFKGLRKRLPTSKNLFVFDANAHKVQQVRDFFLKHYREFLLTRKFIFFFAVQNFGKK